MNQYEVELDVGDVILIGKYTVSVLRISPEGVTFEIQDEDEDDASRSRQLFLPNGADFEEEFDNEFENGF